jgi:prolyl-tRNA synthetase
MKCIRHNILNDTPVIVNTDQYYIPYHKEHIYLNKHGPHATLIMGYDDDKEEYLLYTAIDNESYEIYHTFFNSLDLKNNGTFYCLTSYINTEAFLQLLIEHKDLTSSHLVLPPTISPTQVLIIPIRPQKEGIMKASKDLYKLLSTNNIRGELASINNQNEVEKIGYDLGIPFTIKVSAKELKLNQIALKNNYNEEIIITDSNNLLNDILSALNKLQHQLYKTHLKSLLSKIITVNSNEGFKQAILNHETFVRIMWCGNKECIADIEDTTDYQAKYLPFNQEICQDICLVCHKKANKIVILTNNKK